MLASPRRHRSSRPRAHVQPCLLAPDRARGDADREGEGLPLALQRDQAARNAWATPPPPDAPCRSTPISGGRGSGSPPITRPDQNTLRPPKKIPITISTTPRIRLRRKRATTPTTIKMMPITHTSGTAPPLRTEASSDATSMLCIVSSPQFRLSRCAASQGFSVSCVPGDQSSVMRSPVTSRPPRRAPQALPWPRHERHAPLTVHPHPPADSVTSPLAGLPLIHI